MFRKHPQAGFTLVEMLAVVSILGIVAAIGYPAYQQKLLAGRRVDAWGALAKESRLQERYAVFNKGCYSSTGTPLGGTLSDSGYYVISLETSTPADSTDCGTVRPTFKITATVNPKGSDPKKKGAQVGDKTCNKIILDEQGNRTSLDSDGKSSTGSC